MATRRMRIKATINVPRGGIKSEPQEQATPASQVPAPPTAPSVPSSPATLSSVPSPRVNSPVPVIAHQEHTEIPPTPGGGVFSRACTPPVSIPERIPSSPKSPSPASWQILQRPSPSKSPAGLPPSGSILRRSPSPALSRLTNSPGPPVHYPPSPVKSPVPTYTAPLSPVKFISRTPVVVIPSSSVSLSGGGVLRSGDPVYPQSSASPGPPGGPHENRIKSPVNYLFRPPPSPSPSHHDFHSIKSPSSITSNSSGGVTLSRPSPAQSPVYGASRPPSTPSANFLTHHFNSNSNSADSHEVAALMGHNTTASTTSVGVYPLSPEKRPHSSSGRDSASSRSSHGGSGQGAFSSVSSNVNPSPSFAKTMFENPESLKKRSDDIRKKEGALPNPTKFATARKEFFDKLQSGQAPEPSKLTMLHFTFYNPPNPDKSTKLALAKRKSRSRASSVCSDASSIVKIETDGKNNDENTAAKANSAPSSIAGSRRTTASSVGSAVSDAGHSEAGSVASNSSSGSVPGPRVKVGPDGQLILDEKSLVVETSESQRARQQIEDMEVVSGAEYAVGSSGFYRYKKNYRRGQDWTERETIRFYRALNQCGTDFSMMLSLFPNRTRAELKAKFKREDRRNPEMISKVLASCIFDPDEGISSDEELSQIYDKGTEKERLLNEEKEEEEVICSSEDVNQDGSKKKKPKGSKKKKEIQFSTVQMQEMKELASNTKGIGTGKGRKWNTPVEGLAEGEKLPPVNKKGAGPPLPFQPLSVKQETTPAGGVMEKPKKKYTRKKKQVPPPVEQVGSGGAGATVCPGPAPGTVSIIISSSVISTPSISELVEVKNEKQEPTQPPKRSQDKDEGSGGNKRRSRLPKTKPNVKRGGPAKEAANDPKVGGSETESSANSSQPTAIAGGRVPEEDLFRFDTGDALGPAPLPVVEETELMGNEEGSESLVIVDLDELKSIQESDNISASSATVAASPSSSSKKISPPPKKRKNNTTDGRLPVTTTASRKVSSGVVDPYGKSVMAASSLSVVPASKKGNCDDGEDASSLGQPPNKKVKVLPYRVPGPGGSLPSTRRMSLADELEIEIEMSTVTSSSES